MSVLDKGDLERFFPRQGVSTYDRFRPHEGIRYSLSQTETEFNAGVPYVHLTQTKVEYEPGQDLTPPGKAEKINWLKNKKRGPVWEFIEEIRDRKVIEKIKKLHEINTARNKLAKKTEKKKHGSLHDKIMSRIGPDWYMELSNSQFDTIDSLKNVLLKDHKLKTIVNTQETLMDMGLVLSPNHTCVSYALNKCYNCPVEFLLTLFKITNQKRKKYTVNDKILLSSVVHLTMKDTLKELHIRIPSPPRSQEKMKKQVNDGPPKYDKTLSPYLQRFYFNKQKTVSYIYKNRHKEYPVSRYFDYQDEMYEWYEDTSQPIETLEQKLSRERVTSKYAKPPKIPVRLITRIKPKPTMLQRTIQPSMYLSKCKNIELDMDKHRGEVLLIKTNINTDTLCKCPDLDGLRNYMLQVKISTASEKFQFEQEIAPFDNKKAEKIKVQHVHKKEPPEENRPERVTVFATIKQKNLCGCRIQNVCQYGQGDVCKCYRPEESEATEETSGETVTEEFTTETSTDSCICSVDLQHPKPTATCDPETCICTSSSDEPEPPEPEVQEPEVQEPECICGKLILEKIPSHCICASEESEESDREVCICNLSRDNSPEPSYLDIDPCECFEEKKVRRNEDGCTCSLPPKKLRPEPKDDFFKPPLEKDPGCTCITGDGAANRVCKCLEDPNNVCFCVEKLDLNKTCRCAIPNMAYVRNIPKDLCTCCDPNLDQVDRFYRCTCMGVPQPLAPPKPKPPPPEVKKKKKKKKKEKYVPPCLRDKDDKKKPSDKCTCDRETPECICGNSTSSGNISPVRSFDHPVKCICATSDESLDYIKKGYKKKKADCDAGMPHKYKSKRKKEKDANQECVCENLPPPCCETITTHPRIEAPSQGDRRSAEMSSDVQRHNPTPRTCSSPCNQTLEFSTNRSPAERIRNDRCSCAPSYSPTRKSTSKQARSPCTPFCELQGEPPQQMVPEIYSSKYDQGMELRGKDIRQKQLLQMYLKSQSKPVIEPSLEPIVEPIVETEESKPQKGILNPKKNLVESEIKNLNRNMKEIHFGSEYHVNPMVMGPSNDSNETEKEVEITDECQCTDVMKKFLREHDECITLYDEYQFQIYQRIEEYFENLKDEPCACIDFEKYPTKSDVPPKDFPCITNDSISFGSPDKLSSYCTKTTETDPHVSTCDCDSQFQPTATDLSPPALDCHRSPQTLDCHRSSQTIERYRSQQAIGSTVNIRDQSCGCCPECLVNVTSDTKFGHCDCLQLMEDDDGCICLRTDSDEPIWDNKICDYPALWPCVCDKNKKKGKKGKRGEEDKKVEQQSSKILNLAKFPTKYKDQLKLLKMALGMLAQDHYPLPKLPDCHLLPHFKLWLDLRSKKYISMEKREEMNQRSKSVWYHTGLCQRKVRYPNLGLTSTEIKKMTWKAYKKYHRMIDNCKEDYYRRLKQGYIDETQEFYTTLFHHELYNKSFRDCFFAYLPSDENHIFVINPWQRHEYKDLSRRVPCI